MNTRIYTEALKDRFKSLGYHADELINATSDFDFFHGIATYIVSTIRTSNQRFYLDYIKAKDEYLKLRSNLEFNAPIEIGRTAYSLKSFMDDLGLLKNPDVAESIARIEQILKNKEGYVIPSYLDETYRQIAYLLEHALSMGMIDLVRKYATIEQEYCTVWNEGEHKYEQIAKWRIKDFTFASSLTRLRELDNLWKFEEVRLPWVALEYLMLIEWSWNTPEEFFEGKTLNYENDQARNASMHLLSLRRHWLQVDRIKKREKPSENQPVFSRAQFTRYLKLVLNEVIIQQELPCGSEEVLPNATAEQIMPYKVKLKLNYLDLLLEVQWSDNGLPVT